MTDRTGSASGSSTGSYSGDNVQQHWNAPIANLQETLKDNNFSDYMLIGKDRTGKTQVYSNLSDKTETSELFTDEVKSVIQPESEFTS
jgi:hypothetical protein